MRGAKPAEIPALHGTGKAFADRQRGHVYLLAGYEMVSGDFRAHVDEVFLGDPEFDQAVLWLDLTLGEVSAHGLGGILGLLGTGTELEGDVAVLVLGALRDDLTAFEAEHGHRYVCASFIEEAGHTEFLGKYAGSHRINPLRA